MRRIVVHLASILALGSAGVLAGQVPATQPATPPNPVTRILRASLRGIELSETEKAGLATVSTCYTPQFKAIGEATKPMVAALRSARQAHDTVAARAARRQVMAERRKGIVTLRSALHDIRATLTPEHQGRFDQNIVGVRQALRRQLRGLASSPGAAPPPSREIMSAESHSRVDGHDPT